MRYKQQKEIPIHKHKSNVYKENSNNGHMCKTHCVGYHNNHISVFLFCGGLDDNGFLSY